MMYGLFFLPPILTIFDQYFTNPLADHLIVGQIPTGLLPTISVYNAKVAIKMVMLSYHFGKNLWCTFTQKMNEKYISF